MLLGLLAAGHLITQGTQAQIAGVVRDAETGRPVAEAVVDLPDLDRLVVTDSLGRYRFSDLSPGPQHLTVRRIGYAPRTLHALVPSDGRLQIDIALHPVPVRLPNLVSHSGIALRGLEPADTTPFPDRHVSASAIRNDPLLSEPDGLLALGGGEVSSNLESPEGVSVRGASSDETGYVLDGVPVFSPYHSAGLFSAWNPDALESVQLISSAPAMASPEVLSGTIAAVTRTPGPALTTQGAVSTGQARLAVDGPIGHVGFLASLRTSFPDWAAPRNEASYLHGETHDLLGKLDAPFLSGSLGLLLYQTGNSIEPSIGADSTPARSDLRWSSRSAGVRWLRHLGPTTTRLEVWSAGSDATALWIGGAASNVAARRRDLGLLASVERNAFGSATSAGLKLQLSRTDYQAGDPAANRPAYQLKASMPIATLFVQHRRRLGSSWVEAVSASVVGAAGDIWVSLQNQIRWQLSEALSVSATYLKAHQLSQSLRNSESVTGNIFPADLYVTAGANGVPVARNDRYVLAGEYRPTGSLRLGVQAYVSSYDGLALVAPRSTAPFATNGFATGSATAPGISVDAAWSAPHFGLVARYAWEQVQVEHADSTYTPSYGSDQRLDLGGIVFPSPTWSVRLGLSGAFGRRATGVTGNFEWEACNLLDRGCEFLGTPETSGAPGGIRLPTYLRLDLGLRKHWHLSLAGRDVMLAVYGSYSNLLGRTNVLTFVTDPASGTRSAVEMRPRAPLVVGIDWRF
ncbi:MAG TPA: TonB-dependent receptor [Gemmatimonadales bacterium]|nr:TonB-dependent receptor [Gemmatimonadales bacterium]